MWKEPTVVGVGEAFFLLLRVWLRWFASVWPFRSLGAFSIWANGWWENFPVLR